MKTACGSVKRLNAVKNAGAHLQPAMFPQLRLEWARPVCETLSAAWHGLFCGAPGETTAHLLGYQKANAIFVAVCRQTANQRSMANVISQFFTGYWTGSMRSSGWAASMSTNSARYKTVKKNSDDKNPPTSFERCDIVKQLLHTESCSPGTRHSTAHTPFYQAMVKTAYKPEDNFICKHETFQVSSNANTYEIKRKEKTKCKCCGNYPYSDDLWKVFRIILQMLPGWVCCSKWRVLPATQKEDVFFDENAAYPGQRSA